jgi:RimJ/RimL family protein N-acetyltransferase
MSEKKNNEEKAPIVPFIKGDKLDLLPINIENIDLYFKWINHQDVRMFSRNEIPVSKANLKKWFEPKEGLPTSIGFEVWHKKDSKTIGIGGLNHIEYIPGKANMWLEIGEPQYWNRGLATESVKLILDYAFKEINLHKIFAGIFVPNVASWKCAEKVGFNLEGIIKNDVYVKGKHYDTKKYAMFKDDWLKK